MLFPRQQRWLQHRRRHRQHQRQLWSVSLDDEIGKWILFWMPSNHWQYEEIMVVMCNVCSGTHTLAGQRTKNWSWLFACAWSHCLSLQSNIIIILKKREATRLHRIFVLLVPIRPRMPSTAQKTSRKQVNSWTRRGWWMVCDEYNTNSFIRARALDSSSELIYRNRV